MGNGTRHTRVIGALALVLATAALLAPAGFGKPIPGPNAEQNLLGSQLDRLLPQAASPTTAVQPDVFERAVAQRQAEIADLERALVATEAETARSAMAVYADLVQPTPASQATAGDDGGSFNWGLLGVLSAIAAAGLALGGAAFVSMRNRRVATP
jgi:hypothetical protein